MIINCIIVDDEQPAREIIEGFVAKIHYLKLNGSFKNPLDAITYMQQNQVDLIFLDVQMPDLTGIELFRSTTYKPQVVFTTAYSEYALEGFELNATDYLLKPFTFDRFLTAINKVAERAKPRALQQQTDSPKEYITIHADHKIFKIMLNDILYIEGLKEYVSYYTRDKQRIIALQSLKSLETSLPKNQFLRVHRSYIVPLNKIESLEGNQLRIGQKLIPVGRSYKEVVFKTVFNS